MSHASAADGGTGVRIDIGTRNITKALVIVELTQRKLTEPTEELRYTIARRVVQGNIMGEPYFQLRILPEWIRQQGQGAVYQHARAWLYLGKKTYTELGFKPAQMGDMTRRIGSIGVSMSTLVQYEHITKRVGLHHLGQRIYYTDTYWHWNNENATLCRICCRMGVVPVPWRVTIGGKPLHDSPWMQKGPTDPSCRAGGVANSHSPTGISRPYRMASTGTG